MLTSWDRQQNAQAVFSQPRLQRGRQVTPLGTDAGGEEPDVLGEAAGEGEEPGEKTLRKWWFVIVNWCFFDGQMVGFYGFSYRKWNGRNSTQDFGTRQW